MFSEAAALRLGSTVNAGVGAVPGVYRFLLNTSGCWCWYGSVELCGNAFKAAAKVAGGAGPGCLSGDEDCWAVDCWVNVLLC